MSLVKSLDRVDEGFDVGEDVEGEGGPEEGFEEVIVAKVGVGGGEGLEDEIVEEEEEGGEG